MTKLTERSDRLQMDGVHTHEINLFFCNCFFILFIILYFLLALFLHLYYLLIDLFIKQIKTNTLSLGEGGVTINQTINCTRLLYQRLLFSLERSFIRKYDLICLL